MPRTPAKLLGIGEIHDITNGVCLSNQSEFSITSMIETIKIATGEDFSSSTIATQQSYKGRFGFRDINSQMVAALIAGTSATGAVKKIAKEVQVIASTSVTLAQQPYKAGGALLMAPITIVDQNGRTFSQIASGTPVTGEFVDTGSGKILTVAAADNALTIYVSYVWNDPAAGKTVSANPSAIPSAGAFMFTGRLFSTRTKTDIGSLVVVMQKLQRTGDVAFGATVGDAGTFGFDWELTVDVAADLKICFPAE